MKLKRFFILLSVLCTMGMFAVLATSCEEEKTTEIQIPNAHFTSSSNSSYGVFLTNDFNFQYTLALDEEKSSKGLRITQIDYFWDGQKVATVGGSNLTLNYRIQNQTLGEHQLKIAAKCAGDGYSTTTYTFTIPFTVCDEIPVIDFTCSYPKLVDRNGLLECDVLPVENLADGESISKVAYYLDDRLLIETAMPPYTLSYPVKNEKLGKHKFSISVSFKGIWDGQITRSLPITIQ